MAKFIWVFVATVIFSILASSPTDGMEVLDLQSILPFLHNSLKERISTSRDKPEGFLGLSIKWRTGLPVATFTDYTSLLQFAYPISIPYSIYSEGIEERSDNIEEVERRYRREVREERHEFFRSLEPIIDRLSLPSRTCVLRTICEISSVPFEEDFLGDTLNAIMRASSVGRTEFPDEDHSFNDYIEAEEHGLSHGNCHETYRNCSMSMFDVFFPNNSFT